jgi:hypothetical protein
MLRPTRGRRLPVGRVVDAFGIGPTPCSADALGYEMRHRHTHSELDVRTDKSPATRNAMAGSDVRLRPPRSPASRIPHTRRGRRLRTSAMDRLKAPSALRSGRPTPPAARLLLLPTISFRPIGDPSARGAGSGSGGVNAGLTLPLKLNHRANGIFQTFRYHFSENASGARLKAALTLANGETGSWSLLRIQR